jgi:hypothetical protein
VRPLQQEAPMRIGSREDRTGLVGGDSQAKQTLSSLHAFTVVESRRMSRLRASVP